MPKLLPKGRRERERGFDELRVRVLRLGRYGVLLAIDGVRIFARRGRYAERQGVDVDGGTMSSNCAATLADTKAECPALAAADVDVVAEDGTPASWKSRYGVDIPLRG